MSGDGLTARVLWLVKGLGRGGAERLLALTAPRLERHLVEVAYLLDGHDGFAPDLARHGVPTHCLGARRGVEAGWVLGLRRLLRAGDYDLVHTHSPLPGAVARLLVRSPTRLVHTEHNQWTAYRRPTRVANAATFARNDAVIAVSEGVADSIAIPWWAPGTPPVIETLWHGVDLGGALRGPGARAEARSRLGLHAARPVVGSVANFSAKKDHAGLLAAFDLVRRDVHDAVLLLVGDGPPEARLRADVSARSLDEAVRFLGSRDDVAELLPALDVFVLGSRHEGLPIALLEAMAAEIACVATRVGGVEEVITDRITGRSVPAGDPDALARALVATLRDDPGRATMAAAGLARVRAEFSIDRAVTRIEEIYADVLRKE